MGTGHRPCPGSAAVVIPPGGIPILADQACQIHSRHGVGGNGPRGGHTPRPAIVETNAPVDCALWLPLRQRDRRADRGHQSRPEAAVPAGPVDVDPILGRIGADFETCGVPDVEADIGGEPHNGLVPRAVDVPFGGGVARLTVFRRDLIGRGRARIGRGCRRRHTAPSLSVRSHADEPYNQCYGGRTE